MPKVGNEVFPFSKSGVAAAKAEGKEYGRKVVMEKKGPMKKAVKKKVATKKAAPKKKGGK